MGEVDVKDKSIYHVTCSRGTRKYWKKIFTNFLDMALHNSYILYNMNTDKPSSRRYFIVSVLSSLCESERNSVPPAVDDVLGPPHELAKLPNTNCRLCAVCKKNNIKKKTNFYCPGCNWGIHPKCYHLLEHYPRATRTGGRKRRVASSDSE